MILIGFKNFYEKQEINWYRRFSGHNEIIQ